MAKNGKTKPKILTVFNWCTGHKLTPMFGQVLNFQGRTEYLFNRLVDTYKNIEFIGPNIVDTTIELKDFYDRTDIDGILVYGSMVAAPDPYKPYMWEKSEVDVFRKLPMVYVADPSTLQAVPLTMIPFMNVVRRDNLPVLPVLSSVFEEVSEPLRLLEVIHKLKQSKVLMVGVSKWVPGSIMAGMSEDRMLVSQFPDQHMAALKDTLGTEVIMLDWPTFHREYSDKVSDSEASNEADRLIEKARALKGHSRDAIIKASKYPVAFRKAAADLGVDAIAFNEVPLVGDPRGLPCLASAWLPAEGIPCTVTSRLDGTVTQLMLKYLIGMTGWDSELDVDIPAGHTGFALCCGLPAWEGPSGPTLDYELGRGCMGDGAYATIFDPEKYYGRTVTSAKYSIRGKFIATQTGKLIGGIDRKGITLMGKHPVERYPEGLGCQNSLVVESHAQRIMENWATLDDMIGTDRVLILDDQRVRLQKLSTLLGVDYFPEDGELLDYSHAHRNAYRLAENKA